jgi:hypothetical protein
MVGREPQTARRALISLTMSGGTMRRCRCGTNQNRLDEGHLLTSSTSTSKFDWCEATAVYAPPAAGFELNLKDACSAAT